MRRYAPMWHGREGPAHLRALSKSQPPAGRRCWPPEEDGGGEEGEGGRAPLPERSRVASCRRRGSRLVGAGAQDSPSCCQDPPPELQAAGERALPSARRSRAAAELPAPTASAYLEQCAKIPRSTAEIHLRASPRLVDGACCLRWRRRRRGRRWMRRGR